MMVRDGYPCRRRCDGVSRRPPTGPTGEAPPGYNCRPAAFHSLRRGRISQERRHGAEATLVGRLVGPD